MVLDLGCGCGGDLKKYRESRIGSYVGVDNVEGRVEEAKKRMESARCMFGAIFIVDNISKVYKPTIEHAS